MNTQVNSAAPARPCGGREHFRVAVIGTGFAGLATVHALRKAGISDFVVLERANDVGGTWRDNTYPGIACDVPSHLYSLSFAPNPDWKRTFADGNQIWDYTRRVARDLRIDEVTRFGEEVLDASWDNHHQHWHIQTTTLHLTAQAIIDGSGPLCEPTYPAIEGLDRFAGPIFHSARWDHEQDITGLRVAVIGTGASAIQIVPAIQPKVAEMTVFQRTPAWVLPRMDRNISDAERRLLRAVPLLQRTQRASQAVVRDGGLYQLFHHRGMRRVVEALAKAYLRRAVKDPALRAKLTPNFQIGCKRILISSQWYPALTQPNVTVETAPIQQISEHAIITDDGVKHKIDAIVLATGFHTSDPPIAARLHGRDGRSLAETWAGAPEAFRGVTTANFPNLFRIGGVGTGTGHISHILQIESGVHYAIQALATMQSHNLASVEVTQAAQTAYTSGVNAMLGDTVWVTGGCKSWYFDASGHVLNWPSTARKYRQWTHRFDLENYTGVHHPPTRHTASTAEAAHTHDRPGIPVAIGKTEKWLTATRLGRRLIAAGPEQIADGVWLLRGGFPIWDMNVYLVRDTHPDTGKPGVLAFDTGIRQMAPAIRAAADQLGGLTRIVLGHSHGDHRGSAALLNVPVWCHTDERADVETDGGAHNFDPRQLPRVSRFALSRLIRIWDAGPVKITGTLTDGDDVAGFRVVHLPGHTPGSIALWRASDRLALTSDCFYTLNPVTLRHGPPRLPHRAFNHDTRQAKAAIRKLAALRPAAAWPGHAEPLIGDVAAQLEHAAATT